MDATMREEQFLAGYGLGRKVHFLNCANGTLLPLTVRRWLATMAIVLGKIFSRWLIGWVLSHEWQRSHFADYRSARFGSRPAYPREPALGHARSRPAGRGTKRENPAGKLAREEMLGIDRAR